jgi:hypothetical protein
MTALMRKLDFAEYASGCSRTIAPCTACSSVRADSRVAPEARRPKSSVIRCTRPVTIVADMWCGLVTTFAMISVCAGYGTDGSRTPMIVALRESSRTTLPITEGSFLNASVQKRYVSTTTPSALGPSSPGPTRRPRTGRSPMTLKYEPLTTPARTTRGSPTPTIVKPIVEKSPNAATDFTRSRRS